LRIELEDIGFALSSSGVVIYGKNGSHITFCVKEDRFDAHITNEKKRKRRSLLAIPISLLMEWLENDFYQFILQLINRCSMTEDWLINSGLLFQHFPDEIERSGFFEEFFEKKRGAYRLKDDIKIRLLEPDGLNDGGYVAFTRDFIFEGILILFKPWIVFIPVDEIKSMLCLVQGIFLPSIFRIIKVKIVNFGALCKMILVRLWWFLKAIFYRIFL
jgi:hypothetical protein